MGNSSKTKTKLLSSLVLLLLSMTMFLGTTFAWFTDSVTSSGNIIKAGNLDVEMYYADGTLNPEAPETTWTNASKGEIFNSNLWEPGYATVKHIKIENKGSLALKYEINIVPTGEVSDLADVIDVYYAPSAVQFAQRTALDDDYKLGTLTNVLAGLQTNNTAAGKLSPNEVHTITLALKMQETAGNEYQGLSIGSDFAVQLVATQAPHESESDSFGTDYDEDAEFATTVKNLNEFKAALEVGGEIILANDIVLDKEVNVNTDVTLNLNGFEFDGSAAVQRAIYVTGDSKLTINAEGSTVRPGKYGFVLVQDDVNADVTINGGTFVANNEKGSFICPRGNGVINIALNNLNYTDNGNGSVIDTYYLTKPGNCIINIDGGSYTSKKYIGLSNGSSIKNATLYKPANGSGAVVEAWADATIENCHVIAETGHALTVSGGATLTVKDTVVEATSSYYIYSSGGIIDITGGSYTGTAQASSSSSNEYAKIVVDGNVIFEGTT